MKTATIYVDDVAYGGVDMDGDGEDSQLMAGFRNGWHHTPDDGADKLIWGGEPHVMVGHINLASHVERILRRIERGVLTAHTIRIEIADEPAS